MNDDDFKIQVATALGRIEQKIDGTTAWMTAHAAEDKFMAADIQKLREGGARQRGVLATLTAVGSVLGAGVGYAVDLLTRGHH